MKTRAYLCIFVVNIFIHLQSGIDINRFFFQINDSKKKYIRIQQEKVFCCLHSMNVNKRSGAKTIINIHKTVIFFGNCRLILKQSAKSCNFEKIL